MKIIRNELLKLNNVLAELADNTTFSFKFNYFIGKNIKKVMAELKLIQGALKPSPEFQEYDDQRLRLVKDCSLKDAKGKPIQRQNPNGSSSFDIDPEKQEQFDNGLSELKKQHKAALDEHQKKMDAYNEALEEDVEQDFYCLSIKDFPQSGIAGKHLAVLEPLIKESDAEIEKYFSELEKQKPEKAQAQK